MAIKEPSFRLGCGRYLQSPGAIGLIGEEALRLGRSAFIIGGKTALGLTSESIEKALRSSGLSFLTCEHTGTCNTEDALHYSEKARSYDIIIGVGGGVIMDFSKLIAAYAGKPLINIPTSAATCAAYTPLSVCYTKEGKTVETLHHKKEVDGVIADTELLLNEPPRLLIAGVFDSLAKYTEISHRYHGEACNDALLGLDYAYSLSAKTRESLLENLESALQAMDDGKVTPAFEQVIFTVIAVTGIISSIARGSNQTALAHKFYENARKLHTKESKSYLHGELVGVGLLLQNIYNRTEKDNRLLLKLMQQYSLPSRPSECGLSAGNDTKHRYLEAFLSSSAMQEDGDSGRLGLAMDEFWR